MQGDAAPAGWIAAAIGELARRINIEINAAAAVTPINLVAMAILATPRQALPERELNSQLELYQRLLRDAPYSPLVTVTRDSGAQMIRYAETMGVLERQKHPLGDLMRMNAENAVLATYYRNNILHVFAHALAAGVLFREQCAYAHRGYPTPGVARVSLHFCRAVLALGRSGREHRGGFLARHLRAAQSAAGQRRSQRVAASGADLARGDTSVGCWRRRPFKPSSATTWPSRCCCRPAAAPSHAKRWSSAAISWRSACRCSTG